MTAFALPANSRQQRPTARRSRRAIRRARTLAALFVLLVAVLVLLVLPGQAETRVANPPGATYTVAAGDTLWEIAARYAGEHDVREMILVIKKANNLESVTIQPGQSLFIPAVKGTTIAGR